MASRSRSAAWRRRALLDAILGHVPVSVATVALVFLYVPIAVIVILSFNIEALPRFPISGWSAQWYAAFFDDYRLRTALTNSLVLAVLSTSISLCLATLAALGLMYAGRWMTAVL